MIQIRITKEFLDKYRQYKMDLLEDKLKEDINYKVLEHLITSGFMNLQKIYEELGDYEEITVSLDTGLVVDYELKKDNSTDKQTYPNFKEYISDKINNKYDYYKDNAYRSYKIYKQ